MAKVMAGEGFSKTEVERVRDNRNSAVFFSALCALDALAIRNCFKPNEASALYNSLFLALKAADPPGKNTAEFVFDLMKSFEPGGPPGHPFARFSDAILKRLESVNNVSMGKIRDDVFLANMIGMQIIELEKEDGSGGFWRDLAKRMAVRT